MSIFLALMILTLATGVRAGDPDILTDFVLPKGYGQVTNATFFTYTGVRPLFEANQPPPAALTVSKATSAEFPALTGQGVSLSVLQYPSGTVNPPHTHPRGSELLFLAYGTLEVGFVDTAGKLFAQTLLPGDMFVFPKGLVHYQHNPSPNDTALAMSAFGSSGPGTVSLPVAIFGTCIDNAILAESFKTDVAMIRKIRAGLVPPPK